MPAASHALFWGLTYTASGLPSGLTIDSNGIISGTIDTWASASNTVEIKATDSVGNFATTTFNWNVSPYIPPNGSPWISSSGSVISNEGDSFSPPSQISSLSAGDPDNDLLTWSATGLPTGLTMDVSGNVIGSLDYSSSGTYNVTVSVSDGVNSPVSTSFPWTVNNVNQSPSISISDQDSSEGETVSKSLASGTDPDNDALTYSAEGLPTGLTMDNAGLVTGTLDYYSSDSYTVTVTVTDGQGGSANTTFTWNVANVNRAPEFGQVDGTSDTQYDSVTKWFNAATDPDDDLITYTADNLPSGLGIDSDGRVTGYLSVSPGDYTVTLRATDSAGDSATTTFVWTINPYVPPNGPPSIYGPDSKTSNEGDSFSEQLITASDPENGTLVWEVVGLPPGVTIVNGYLTGTLDYTSAGTHDVSVTVTDPGGLTVGLNFTWYVNDVNQSPSIDEITPPTGVVEGASANFRVDVGRDPDGDSLTYTAEGLPPGLTISEQGWITGTPGYSAAGTYELIVKVTDSGGLQAQRSFTLTIGNVPAPDASIEVSASASSLWEGDSFSLYATVGSPSFATVTGTVEFFRDGVRLGTGTLDGSGTATLAVANGWAAGTYEVTVHYLGSDEVAEVTGLTTIYVSSIGP